MIPLRLEMTNFLSYRDTAVLNFNGIHLACISGANGAGKSSILDSMTWALFGKARSKSDDDLVNRRAILDDDTAEIRFSFALENSTYRVIRRKRAGKATQLELQMLADGDLDKGKWKTLSESKVRETETAIVDLLRMNYDTFINASFLLQGKADEFTTKTPGRRKEILADLLGVSQWDVYKEAASEQRKAAEGQLLLVDGQLGDIALELGEEEDRAAALAAAQAARQAIADRLADKEKLLTHLRRAETAVHQQQEMVANLANNQARAQRTLADMVKTQSQRQTERAEYETILAEAAPIAAAFAAYEQAQANLQTWQARADEHHKLQGQKRPYELTLTQERSRLEQRQRELETQHAKSAAARSERTAVAAQLADAQSRLAAIGAEMAGLAQQVADWHEARETLQRLEAERQSLLKEQSRLQTEARKMAALAEEQTAVSANRVQAEQSLTQLTAELAAAGAQNERYAVAKAELDSLQAEQPRLKAGMNKLRDRLDRLQEEAGGDCPLCGQPLSDDHRRTVLAELEAEGKESADRFRANKQRIEALAAETADLEQQLKQKPRLERDQQAQQQRLHKAEARLGEMAQSLADWAAGGQAQLAELEQKVGNTAVLDAQKQQVQALSSASQAKEKLEKEQQAQQKAAANAAARLVEIDRLLADWESAGQAALAEVKKKLETGDYAGEAQAALKKLEAQVANVGYEAAAHEAAKAARDELAGAPGRREALQQAQAAVKPLEGALADLAAQITQQQQTVADLTQQRETAVTRLAELQTDGGDVHAAEDEVFQLREEEITANRQVGAAQQRLAVLDDLRIRREQLTAVRAEKTLHIQRLKLLEKACGRDGVQALLIEQALPEIEERANELLERLTGGDMRVFFETQKQLKSRDAMAETLDIRIIDGAGERPYDNYSGGEQFRVNFAVRLALSQLLARRSGARLQTLVIDEGFGSQDPNGRQRLVEAINTIQDDFARILVITHIDELRDAFPTRIEVTKTAVGSTIAVV
ncbi:MAG: SMC family ATPase [Chloroflexi bacterium]|nr:SMC family ATPase [Chloroflexota bacterium]MBP7041521.1 SMC family ATPase [Chloroflexota bacterium]